VGMRPPQWKRLGTACAAMKRICSISITRACGSGVSSAGWTWSIPSPVTNSAHQAGRWQSAPTRSPGPRLFISRRGQPLTRQSVNYLVAETAARAGLPPVHLHILRHSPRGFSLANRGYELRLIHDTSAIAIPSTPLITQRRHRTLRGTLFGANAGPFGRFSQLCCHWAICEPRLKV
jgi:hypothetical protein